MTPTTLCITASVAVLACALTPIALAQQPVAGRGASPTGPKDLAVTQYANAWSKTTEAEILEALKTCWTPESTYTDPQTDPARGPMELARVILNFHKALPGATLTATSRVDVHHNVGRFSWHLKAPSVVGNGVTQPPQESDGFDFVDFNVDGTRILRIVGFFGPFPK